jgi:hypothetical protein
LIEIKRIKKTKIEKEKIKIINKIMEEYIKNKENELSEIVLGEKNKLIENYKEQENEEEKWKLKVSQDDFFLDISEKIEDCLLKIFDEFEKSINFSNKKKGSPFKNIFKTKKDLEVNKSLKEIEIKSVNLYNLIKEVDKKSQEEYSELEKGKKFKTRTLSFNQIIKRGSTILKKPLTFEDSNKSDSIEIENKKKFYKDLEDNNLEITNFEIANKSIEIEKDNLICEECNERISKIYCLTCKTNQCDGKKKFLK